MKKKNTVAPLFGFLTLIFSFITVACIFLKAWVTFWIFLVLLLVTFTVFVSLRLQEFVDFFKSRQLRYGANVALSSVGVVGIAVFVNVIIVQRFDKRADLTDSKRYSLSEQTKLILKQLDKEVNIIALYTDENSLHALHAKDILELYSRESKEITLTMKNPNADTALIAKYGLDYDGTIVFESKDRIEKITVVDEQKFTSALLRIIQDKTKKVYFLSGHGEHGIDGSTNYRYRQVRIELEKQNYEVLTHSLLKEQRIPIDCDVLVIAGPTKPISVKGVEIIEDYLAKNGKLLLLLDPSTNSTQDVNLELVKLMKNWGVKVGNNVVIDQQHFFPWLGGTASLDLQFEPHDITRYFFQEQIPFVFCRSVMPLEEIPDNLSVKSIAKTKSPKGISWAETTQEVDGKFSSNGYTDGVDIPGPLSIAVAVEQRTNANSDNSETSTPTRIVVFGDSDFATDTYFATNNPDLPDIPAYKPLFPSIVNWLTLDEDLITIVPPDLSNEVLRKMNVHQIRLVQLTSVFLIPLIVFITGMVVWWRRREGETT